MASSTIEVKIDGVEDMRRLSAALEQYNANSRGDAAQIEALRLQLAEALDNARAAELEQFNAEKRADELGAELDKTRHQLHNASNAAIWSAGVLRGGTGSPRCPGVPISLLETAASAAHTKIREQAHEINSRDNQIDQMAADLAKLTSRASIAEAASREKDKKLAEYRKANDTAIAILDEAQFSTLTPDDYNNNPLLREIAQRVVGGSEQVRGLQDWIHQLERVHDQQVAALTAARNNVEALQRESQRWQGDASQAIQMLQGKRTPELSPNEAGAMLLREVSVVVRALESNSVTIRNLQGELGLKIVKCQDIRKDLAEVNDTITKQAGIIKHLHEEYHQLQARKMGAEFDLERANDEIAAAEAEIAKYKPLVDAVRAGLVYGCSGKWVRVKAATVADLNEGTAVSFFIPNSEDPQCL